MGWRLDARRSRRRRWTQWCRRRPDGSFRRGRGTGAKNGRLSRLMGFRRQWLSRAARCGCAGSRGRKRPGRNRDIAVGNTGHGGMRLWRSQRRMNRARRGAPYRRPQRRPKRQRLITFAGGSGSGSRFCSRWPTGWRCRSGSRSRRNKRQSGSSFSNLRTNRTGQRRTYRCRGRLSDRIRLGCGRAVCLGRCSGLGVACNLRHFGHLWFAHALERCGLVFLRHLFVAFGCRFLRVRGTAACSRRTLRPVRTQKPAA